MMIYQDKERPWSHICVRRLSYARPFFFRFKLVPHNTFMAPPRFHAMINLFLVSFWRDNAKICLGVGWGRKQWQLILSHII